MSFEYFSSKSSAKSFVSAVKTLTVPVLALALVVQSVFFGDIKQIEATTQNTSRWRNDDGSQSTATYSAAENTPLNASKNTPYRLRFGADSDVAHADLLRAAALALPSYSGSITNVATDSSTGYMYFCTSSSPSMVLKVAPGSGSAAPTLISSLTLNTGENGCNAIAVDSGTGYGYVGSSTSPGIIVKFNLGSGSNSPTRMSALSLNTGENAIGTGALDTTNKYFYVGTQTSPGIVVKVDVSGSGTPSRVGAVSVDSPENNLTSSALDLANNAVYFGTNNFASASYILKIGTNGSGAPTWSSSDVLVTNTGETGLTEMVADLANGKLYVGTTTSPAIVVKVSIGSGVPTRDSALTLNTGENIISSSAVDATAGYAFFGTNTSPGRVVKVQLTSGTSVPIRIGAVTLNSGENILNAGTANTSTGYAFFGGVSSFLVKVDVSGVGAPTRTAAVTLVKDDSLTSGVVDTVNGYAYFGTNTSPGSIIKVQLGSGNSPPVRIGEASDGFHGNYTAAAIDVTNGFAYFGTNTASAYIVRVALGTGSADPTISDSSFSFTPGNIVSMASDISANGYIYAGTSGSPGTVHKIYVGDGTSTPSVISSLTLQSGENGLLSAAADVSGHSIYFGTNTSPGRVVLVYMGNGANAPTRSGAVTLNTGENILAAGAYDPTFGRAYFVTSTSPAIVVKLSGVTRLSALTLNSGENGSKAVVINPTAGNMLVATNTSPSIVVEVGLGGSDGSMTRLDAVSLNSGENTPTSGVIDPSNGYAYFGTNTVAGIVVKVQAPGPLVNFKLEYGEKISDCDSASYTPVAETPAGEAWAMSDSANITDGAVTTDSAGITNGNSNFVAGEIHDTTNQTGNITLDTDEFTEIEYSILATDDSVYDTTYCFRMNNILSGDAINYSAYAEATIDSTTSDLSLTKTVDNNVPYMGDTVAYTVTVTNGGPLDAVNVVVKDLLPAGVTHSSNTPSQGSYVPGTGMWTVGTILDGASANIVINATVNTGTVNTTITNFAEVWSVDQPDSDSTAGNSSTTEDDDASAAIDVQAASDLSLTKNVDDTTPDEAQHVTYTVTLTNGGPDPATGNVVTDLLPAGVTYVSHTPSQGSYVSGTGVWTVGTVNASASATLDIVASVDPGSSGATITNIAELTATTANDPDSTPNNGNVSEDDYASRDVTVNTFGAPAGGTPNNVVGQPNFTTGTSTTTASGLDLPTSSVFDPSGDRLFVADRDNNRVLVYSTPTGVLNSMNATYVLGQSNFTTSGFGATDSTMRGPRGLIYDSANQRLFVADTENSRVLVFNVTSISNGQAATRVLGQADFTSSSINRGGSVAANTLNKPVGLAYRSSDQTLFVADTGNHRVLSYAVTSITNGQAAANQLGQASFTAGSANRGSSTAANTLSSPSYLEYDSSGSRLFASDGGNNRVLAFDMTAFTNGEDAAYVLGQSSFTATASGTTRFSMNLPRSIAYRPSGSLLYVADQNNNRVLTYSVATMVNGESAVNVFGQSNYTSSAVGTTLTTLRQPEGVDYDPTENIIFVADMNNNRLLAYGVVSGDQADLSLTASVDESAPDENETVVYTVTVSNGGPDSATGVVVTVPLPAGVDHVSDVPSQGSYVSGTGVWTIGTIANGASKTLDITTTMGGGTRGSTFTVVAEVTSSGVYDPDSAPGNALSSEDDYDAQDVTVGPHNTSTDPTTTNAITLTRQKVGATATVSVSFALQNTLSGVLTVTFPAGFTIVTSPTSMASSACLGNFGHTSTTMYATKTNCSGIITLSGGTVINPSIPGSYVISWVNDDPGEGAVTITSDDQVNVAFAVGPRLTFNVGAQSASTACDGTFVGNGGAVPLDDGPISVTAVASSDVSTVKHICTRVSTNASGGATITVRNANGASGMVSTESPTATITSATGTLTPGTQNYGICVGSGGSDTGNDAISGSASPVRASPYDGSCSTTTHVVGGLSSTDVPLWTLAGPAQNAFARVFVKAAFSILAAAHPDYTDTLTFIATATF